MIEPKELYALNPNAKSTTYIHRKRKTRYKKTGTYQYVDASPAYDMDELLLIECEDDTVLIKSTSPDLQTRLDLGQLPIYKGKLQCTLPVMFGTQLVMYVDVNKHIIWFRPEVEFNDPQRFEKVPYVG